MFISAGVFHRPVSVPNPGDPSDPGRHPAGLHGRNTLLPHAQVGTPPGCSGIVAQKNPRNSGKYDEKRAKCLKERKNVKCHR